VLEFTFAHFLAQQWFSFLVRVHVALPGSCAAVNFCPLFCCSAWWGRWSCDGVVQR
jgi:hypothetical protein